MAEDFSDVLPMMIKVNGVNKDIVKVNHNTNIEHVCENSIDEMLEGCWGIREPKGHNQPFIETIARVEHSFPLVAFMDADKVICMAEVNLSIDFHVARRI